MRDVLKGADGHALDREVGGVARRARSMLEGLGAAEALVVEGQTEMLPPSHDALPHLGNVARAGAPDEVEAGGVAFRGDVRLFRVVVVQSQIDEIEMALLGAYGQDAVKEHELK